MGDENKKQMQIIANMLYTSRNDAGFSQEQLAAELGVSKKTIRNWEHGTSCPDLIQTANWFKILKLNSLKYMLKYKDNNNQNENILFEYFKRATPHRIAQLRYLVDEREENVWDAMVDMDVMHALLSLRGRARIAKNILDEYLLEEKLGLLKTHPEAIEPNVENLRNAIDTAEKAVVDGRNTINRR